MDRKFCPLPRRAASLPVVDTHSTATRERWRQVLAQSNQEMLRELAAQATKAVGSGEPGRSMEQLALDVADRMLNQASTMMLLESENGQLQDFTPTDFAGPLLDDLEAVPWNIWSGALVCDAEDLVPVSPWARADTPLSSLSSRTRSKAGRPRAATKEASPALTPRTAAEASSSVAQPPKSAHILQSDKIERRNSFDLHKPFDRKFSEVHSVQSDEVPLVCGAVMYAGLQLLTTTQEHTWLRWQNRPRNVLLVAKQGDPEVAKRLREISVWADSQGVTIIVEPGLLKEMHGESSEASAVIAEEESRGMKLCWCSGNCSCPRMRVGPQASRRSKDKDVEQNWGWGGSEGLPPGFVDRVRTWTPGEDELERAVDLVICIGGDGSLCWAAGLFSGAMPPVIAFAGGSLGFLTPFAMDDWVSVLVPMLGATSVEIAPVKVACRMRFQMRVLREGADEDGPPIPVQALNEVLVHRGSSGHLCKLEVWVGKSRVTMVQGDGLIIATPTGSTAYSLAAGGSMLHPSVPGIILTPVCPHSLSFRPVVLPDSAVVTVRVPANSRSSRVMVAVDGKDRIELMRGDSIEVAVSPFPLPTVCKNSVTDDWFLSVNEALQWNLRLEQKGLTPPAQM
mmetsp:Transcript_100111/g.254597  ORF Transcript_100111/g.254597 Transcript_100111/m.254597 type:complete len:623 (+) Transcript_100111:50-1918(+)